MFESLYSALTLSLSYKAYIGLAARLALEGIKNVCGINEVSQRHSLNLDYIAGNGCPSSYRSSFLLEILAFLARQIWLLCII